MMGMSYRIILHDGELGLIKRRVLHNSRSWLTERLLSSSLHSGEPRVSTSTSLEIRPRGDITQKKDAAHV